MKSSELDRSNRRKLKQNGKRKKFLELIIFLAD